jgi:hypothetical protein|tara:strand:- start:5781 stop:6365 length:585 start_codon:yes stop_codon:yes gene_type:complete
MNNEYDEIKNLLKSSRNLLSKNKDLAETRRTLQSQGLLKELDIKPDNLALSSEKEIDIDTQPQEDKQKTYRVSGGLISLHGKEKQDLELSTDEKLSYQETMDDFVNEVSDLSDFGTLNIYPNSVDWSGKVIDLDLEFYFTIGENNGVYINGDMIKLDPELVELIGKLTSFYEKFKSKWAKTLAQRKKTMPSEEI